ncbi:MAG: TRAP transporter large permease [Planctomycetota bacterium]|jgi:C4-dicarboxylate transporter DctM subunit|nr:TRAP transporter large permease [Planctomycetota bacterium]
MSAALTVLLVSFAIFMAARIPLAFTMLLSASLYMIASGQKLTVVSHRLFTGIDTFTLMAIPFFILASELMVVSGTAERLLDFANMLVGGLRGGLAYVNVFASMMFGGCSGSAIADVAGLGRLEIAMMTKGGYTLPFSAAVTVSSSIQGPLIPPSITMVLIGAVTGSSIGALLLGGAIPGILVGLSQCVVIFIYGRRRNFPVQKLTYTNRDRLRISLSSIPFLLMPAIIVGGIITGWFTPTEAAAVAVLYGIILTIIYRRGRVSLGELRGVFGRSVVTATSILMLSGASNIFGWILTSERVPTLISGAITSLTGNKHFFLLLVNIFLLVFGMVMDSMPAITILTPILFPIATSMGIDPVHFGVVVGFNLIVGLITPPYGVALFTGTIVSGLPMEKLIRELVPFILSSLAILALVTYVPQTVLFVPALFGLDK